MNSPTYKTKDLYLASFIYSKQQKLIRVDREDRICWFIFAGKSDCEHLAQQYWLGEAEGNIKTFTSAIQSLKDLIYAYP